MNRLSLTLAGCVLGLTSPHALTQETAKVEVTLKIAKTTPSFKDLRLVVMLHHDHPLQDDRGPTAVDRHVDAKFGHQQGKETVLTITLGDKAKLKAVPYFVNITVFDKGSKVTHISEKDEHSGPFHVLTNGAPSKIAVIVRPARP